MPDALAVTWNEPTCVFAVTEMAATPVLSVVTVAGPENVTLAPLDGAAKVTKNGRTVNELGANDFLGEIALLSDVPRTATVTTTTETTVLVLTDRAFRRAGMDYLDQVTWMRHDSWTRFEQWRRGESYRLLLFTTKADVSYLDFRYAPSDILLFGRETVGVTDEVVAAADARLKIPMKASLRSLNVAMAAAVVTGEALRQTRT